MSKKPRTFGASEREGVKKAKALRVVRILKEIKTKIRIC